METRSLGVGALLLFVASLARFAVEGVAPRAPLVPEGPDPLPALTEESREALEEEARRERPLAPGERIDPNRADEVELDRLPGIGPSTARAITEARELGGGFRGPEDLLRVRGIGEKTLRRIRDLLDFSHGLPPELSRRAAGGIEGTRPESRIMSPGPVPNLSNSVQSDPGRFGEPRVDVNTASLDELITLPGIGPALAGRIIRNREKDGPFLEQEDLLRVKGIGTSTLEKISGMIRPAKMIP